MASASSVATTNEASFDTPLLMLLLLLRLLLAVPRKLSVRADAWLRCELNGDIVGFFATGKRANTKVDVAQIALAVSYVIIDSADGLAFLIFLFRPFLLAIEDLT